MNILQINKRSRKKIKLVFVLAVLVVISAGLYYSFNSSWNRQLKTNFVLQKKSFDFFVKTGNEVNYSMIMGDLNGLNHESGEKLIKIVEKKQRINPSIVIVPSMIAPDSRYEVKNLTQESFLDQISNEREVVLVDNFCTKNWNSLSEKKIYQVSVLSPGPYCFSEPETKEIDTIINSYRVKKVFVVYNTPSYKEFIANFLEYLEEKEIEYEFVQSEKIEEVYQGI